MGKEVFVKFVSEPKNDQIKSIVGLACAAQAIEDGHNVSVFFAAAGTRLLDASYIQELDNEMGQDSTVVAGFMEKIFIQRVRSTADYKEAMGVWVCSVEC